MPIKVERRDGSPERQVVIGCVISKQVLAPIADRWKFGLFASKWSNLIVGWCVQHYRKYHRAPGRAIEAYYRQWAEEDNQEKETVQAIESLLVSLSEESERLQHTLSTDHLLDIAAVLFEKIHLTDLFDRGRAHVERGEVDKARDLVAKSRKLEIGMGAGVHPLSEESIVESAFEKRGDILIEYPGAIGNFFGSKLGRDQFVSFLGKEKSGKSFWLQEVAWRAVEQGRTVAYFELGDLSQAQVVVRFGIRACGRPAEPGRYPYPVKIDHVSEMPEVEPEYRTEKRGLSADDVKKEFRRVGADDPDRFKLSCHAAGSLSVGQATAILEEWARDGFNPDVVIFDYADLAKTGASDDKLEETNAVWMEMRGLSQKLHCLVLTATQCNRQGFDVRTLRREHVGGFHMKLAHVTGMIGINQTTKEKESGLFRLNWVLSRELEFGEDRCCWCASALAVGNPVVKSTF